MTLDIPKPQALAALVDAVTRDWANLAAVHAGLPAPGPANLPLEYCVQFTAPIAVHMVVRCRPELAADLAEGSTGDRSARDLREDAFREFANMLAEQWALVVPTTWPSPWEALQAQASLPQVWPAKEPDTACVVLVNHHPLELRVWLL